MGILGKRAAILTVVVFLNIPNKCRLKKKIIFLAFFERTEEF